MSTDTDVLPPWVSPALAHLRSEARLLLALSTRRLGTRCCR